MSSVILKFSSSVFSFEYHRDLGLVDQDVEKPKSKLLLLYLKSVFSAKFNKKFAMVNLVHFTKIIKQPCLKCSFNKGDFYCAPILTNTDFSIKKCTHFCIKFCHA